MAQSESPVDARVPLTWFGFALLFLAVVGLLWFGGHILLVIFAGILFAVVLRAPTGLLERTFGVSRRLAFTVVLITLVALLVGFAFVAGPQLLEQGGQFVERVPGMVASVQEFLRERNWGQWLLERLGGSGGEGQGQASGQGGASGQQSGGGGGLPAGLGGAAVNFTTTLVTTGAHLAFIVVLGIFLGANPTFYRRGVVRLFPVTVQQRAAEVIDELGNTLRFWLMGQLALMFITGFATFIGLSILGVPLALVLAFFVALMEFIPFIGPIIGFIPILMISATQGISMLLWALILYIVIQQLEGNILTPLVQQRAVALPPALTVAAVFLGSALFGPIGAILGTPLIAVVFILVKLLYVHDVLGQRIEVPGGHVEEAESAQP